MDTHELGVLGFLLDHLRLLGDRRLDDLLVLHLLGVLRAQQGHPGEGASLLARAVAAQPLAADAHAHHVGEGRADGEGRGRGHDAEGRAWFPTGDVATIDADGYMQITDRSKDVIKSGGEWISSIDIENIAMAHPAVTMAACIGVPHPKWNERPLLVAVKAPGANPTKAEILDVLGAKIAKWQMPDDVVFVDALPMTTTGKVQRRVLRLQEEERAGLGLLDGDGQAAAGMLRVGFRLEADPAQGVEAHPVADHRMAKVQVAHQAVLATLDDMAGLEAGQEGARILRAAQQAEPQLFAGERGQQRVGEIIDLDQVFEFQVLLPSGQGGSLPARPAHGTTSVAPHPAR